MNLETNNCLSLFQKIYISTLDVVVKMRDEGSSVPDSNPEQLPELPLGNLIPEEHADDGDQDVVRDRADDDGA